MTAAKLTRLSAGLLGLAVFAQLAVPAWMIAERERVLRHGEVFKFRTAPVDPYDAFRGRYVALRFEESSVPAMPGLEIVGGMRLCVAVTNGADGFARYGAATREPPATGAWIRVKAWYSTRDRIQLQPPTDRFYMNEDDAPDAEAAYRDSSRVSNRTAYAQMRVLGGNAAIEDLYVGGTSIREFVRARRGSGAAKRAGR